MSALKNKNLEDYMIMKSEGDKPPKGFEKFFKKKEERAETDKKCKYLY
jgi:hypothetical protein